MKNRVTKIFNLDLSNTATDVLFIFNILKHQTMKFFMLLKLFLCLEYGFQGNLNKMVYMYTYVCLPSYVYTYKNIIIYV